MAKQTYIAQVRNALSYHADQVSKRKDGTIVIRKGFYYRQGKDAQDFFLKVGEVLKEAGVPCSVKDYGEKWTAFKGGSALAKSSHWWVELWPVDTVG